MTTKEASESKENTPQQKARAKLRESFLQAITELQGEPCNILTYEQSVLQADFCGWNIEGQEILVRELVTPPGIKLPAALLRTQDVLALQFEREL